MISKKAQEIPPFIVDSLYDRLAFRPFADILAVRRHGDFFDPVRVAV